MNEAVRLADLLAGLSLISDHGLGLHVGCAGYAHETLGEARAADERRVGAGPPPSLPLRADPFVLRCPRAHGQHRRHAPRAHGRVRLSPRLHGGADPVPGSDPRWRGCPRGDDAGASTPQRAHGPRGRRGGPARCSRGEARPRRGQCRRGFRRRDTAETERRHPAGRPERARGGGPATPRRRTLEPRRRSTSLHLPAHAEPHVQHIYAKVGDSAPHRLAATRASSSVRSSYANAAGARRREKDLTWPFPLLSLSAIVLASWLGERRRASSYGCRQSSSNGSPRRSSGEGAR